MSKFTFLIASARENGNSEQLAKIAAESFTEKQEQQWLALRDYPLPSFEDRRHGDKKYQAPIGNALTLFDATISCDHLVFVTPVYWYSVATPLKHYLDYWSHWMRVEDGKFKERMASKTLWVISTSAGASAEATPMFDSLNGVDLSLVMGLHPVMC